MREALLGEIRLQWWRDTLQGEARGDVRGNPVAAALDDTIVRFRLPRQALVDLIDARVFDLYDDPMPSLNDLEGYCGETSSSVIRLASLILADGGDPGTADAAGHAGVAYAITGLLRAFPWHARRGQVFLPMQVFARHGVARDDIVTGRGGPGLRRRSPTCAPSPATISRARALRATVPPATRRRSGRSPSSSPISGGWSGAATTRSGTVVDLPQWKKQWLLWRAARRGGV